MPSGFSPLRRQPDFRAVVGLSPVARQGRFAWHLKRPSEASANTPSNPSAENLSTGQALGFPRVVDESENPRRVAQANVQLGVVISKRFAPKAVTRNLVRRQAREAVRQALREGLTPHATATPRGSELPTQWVIRVRQPVAPKAAFHSASSSALKTAVAADLRSLLGLAAR